MYAAVDLSKYIISKCIADDCPISNLQLQKILYYIQKEYLIRGSIAFPDEIEAWQFGPVVPNVYYHFCGYGAMQIFYACESFDIAPEDKVIVDPIVESKRELPPWTLVKETHKKGGAWEQTYKNGSGNRQIIDLELIRSVG